MAVPVMSGPEHWAAFGGAPLAIKRDHAHNSDEHKHISWEHT